MRIISIGGKVISGSDGQVHTIGSQALLKLYPVPMHSKQEIKILHKNENNPYNFKGFRFEAGDIVLKPRYDGKYNSLPKPLSNKEARNFNNIYCQ